MITMEFNEIKKVWDAQNNEPIYGINERALHNLILSKKKQAHHITNVSELLAVVANIGAGAYILSASLYKQNVNIFLYLLALWMFATALYVLISRMRRRKGKQQFDRSMYGDLKHAIAVAAYQVRLSYLLRWNILPIAILIVLGILDNGNSIWLAIGVVVFLVLANYAAGWEHNIYKARKRELEALRRKLDSEDPDNLQM